MARHALTDEQWARLEPLLPKRSQGRKSMRGDRSFIDAVLFRAKTGIQWRDLPERFGPWKTVYNRFANWAAKDHWARIFRSCSSRGMKPGPSSTAQWFAPTKMRRAEKGDPAKRSWPLSRRLFDEDPCHSGHAGPSAPHRDDAGPAPRNGRSFRVAGVCARRAFHWRYRLRLERVLAVRSAIAGSKLSSTRSPIESARSLSTESSTRSGIASRCFFHGLKRFRAVATRYEKTAQNYLALVHVACMLAVAGVVAAPRRRENQAGAGADCGGRRHGVLRPRSGRMPTESERRRAAGP